MRRLVALLEVSGVLAAAVVTLGMAAGQAQAVAPMAVPAVSVPLSPIGRQVHQAWTGLPVEIGAPTFNGSPQALNGFAEGVVAAAATTVPGRFTALSPVRVLDTRIGNGAPVAAVGPGQQVRVQITGAHGVPTTGVGAVALNLTVTGPTQPGYLAAYPDGAARPVGSSLNFAAGATVADFALVPVGADGKIALYNASPGTVQIIADLAGYHLAGRPTAQGAYATVGPVRVLDTRIGNGAPAAAVGPGQQVRVQITGAHGVPTTGVGAVALNVTVTGSTEPGYVTTYPDGTARPLVSNLNFFPGATIAGFTVVPVGADGKIALYNGSPGTVHLVADLAGYYLAGHAATAGTLQTVPQHRILDTRTGLGATPTPVRANGSLTLQITGTAGIPTTGVAAVIADVTAITPTAGGYLTVYPAGSTQPNASNIDFPAHTTVANLVVVPVDQQGRIQVSNASGGTTNLLVDIAGYLTGTPITTADSDPAACNALKADPAGTAVTRWNPITLCILAALHQSAGNITDVNIIIEHESSGNPNAINLYDINAKLGHPAEGLIQVIRPTFDVYRTLRLPDDLYNPAANLYAGLNYAIHTYGTIHNIPGLVALRSGGGFRGYVQVK